MSRSARYVHIGLSVEKPESERQEAAGSEPHANDADGKVFAIINHVKDNPPGTVNEFDNWGNYIIIEHAPGEYMKISHFKEYSIVVRVGDRVTQGQLLGLCGNSGYSPEPHLHIQRQKGPFPGAETLPLRFSHITISHNDTTKHYKQVNPPEGSFVSNAEISDGSKNTR